MSGGRAQKEWRSVAWLPGYEISEDGAVRHSTRKATRPAGYILKGCVQGDGYRIYKLPVGGVKRILRAHRLVCEAFHGPASGERVEVAHGDGDSLNNHQSNLRWATRQENDDDRKAHGTDPSGDRNPRAKLKWADVRSIRSRFDGTRKCILRLAQEYSFSEAGMRAICSGRNWREPA